MGHDKRFVVLECDNGKRPVATGDSLEEIADQLSVKTGRSHSDPLDFDSGDLLEVDDGR